MTTNANPRCFDFVLIFYLVTDTFGNTWTGVVECENDHLEVCDLQDVDRTVVYFDGQFKHLQSWCTMYGFDLAVIRKAVNVSF